MEVKYNKELAKAVLEGKERGEFYQKTDNGSEQVFPTIVTHRGEDLICFFKVRVDYKDQAVTRFRTLTPEEEGEISIRLFDLEIGDIIACDVNDKDEVLVGVLSGIHDNVIEVSCWARIDSNRLEKGSDKFCHIKRCKYPSKETRDKFLKLLDEKGYCLRDGKLCEKVKHFYPFQKVIIKVGGVYRADFFSHLEGPCYNTTSGWTGFKKDILPYSEENKHLIGTRCN